MFLPYGIIVGNIRFRSRTFGSCQKHDEPDVFKNASFSRAPQAVVTDFVKSLGRDMLEETSDEFLGFEGQALPTSAAVFRIGKGDGGIIHLFDLAVVYGHSVDVAGQVFQDGRGSVAGLFDMHHPFLGPALFGYLKIGPLFAYHVQEYASKNGRDGFLGEKITVPAVEPVFPVRRNPAPGDQAMDVRMIVHGSGPGVQNGHNADLAADVFGVGGQRGNCGGGRFHHYAVEVFLVRPKNAPPLFGYSDCDMEIRDGQDFDLPFFKPDISVFALTFGTSAVFT